MISKDEAVYAVALTGSIDAARKHLKVGQKEFRKICKSYGITAKSVIGSPSNKGTQATFSQKGIVLQASVNLTENHDVQQVMVDNGFAPAEWDILKTQVQKRTNHNSNDTVVLKFDATRNLQSLGLRTGPQKGSVIVRAPKRTVKYKSGEEKWLVVGDLHFGQHHNPVFLQLFLDQCRVEQPTHIAILGDLLDVACLSSFDAVSDKQIDTLNMCTQHAYEWLKALRSVVPTDTKIKYLQGNHEVRMNKALIKTHSVFRNICLPGSTMPVLSEPVLLGFDALDIEYVGGAYPDGKIIVAKDLAIIHGQAIGPNANKKTLTGITYSVVYGHTHALSVLGQSSTSLFDQTTHRFAYNIGHGSMNDGHGYCSNPENWLNSWGVIDKLGDQWNVDTVKVNTCLTDTVSHGTAIYQGKFLETDTGFDFPNIVL